MRLEVRPTLTSGGVVAVFRVLSPDKKTMVVFSLALRKGSFSSSVLWESGFSAPGPQSWGRKENPVHEVLFLCQRDSLFCGAAGTTWARLSVQQGLTISGRFWEGQSGKLVSLVWLLVLFVSLVSCEEVLSVSRLKCSLELNLER